MSSNKDENDLLVSALLKIRKKQMEDKLERYRQFNFDIEAMLTHLAGLSPKEQRSFLKPWEEGNQKIKLGRPSKKGLDFELPTHIEELKKRHKEKTGKELSDKRVLEKFADDHGYTADKANPQIKTIQNDLAKARRFRKKNHSS